MSIVISYNKKNKESLAKTISHLYSNEDIPDYIMKAILNRLIWIATENDNEGKFIKYFGQQYWSYGALEQLNKNKKHKKSAVFNLRHEHSVPKKEIISMITKSDKTYESIYNILNNFAHSVVVSLDEDISINKKGLRSKMPKELEKNNHVSNIFSRYISTGIEIYDLEGFDPKIINLKKIKNFKKIT